MLILNFNRARNKKYWWDNIKQRHIIFIFCTQVYEEYMEYDKVTLKHCADNASHIAMPQVIKNAMYRL